VVRSNSIVIDTIRGCKSMRTIFDVIKMVEKSSKYHRPKNKDMKRASRRGRVEPRRREPKKEEEDEQQKQRRRQEKCRERV